MNTLIGIHLSKKILLLSGERVYWALWKRTRKRPKLDIMFRKDFCWKKSFVVETVLFGGKICNVCFLPSVPIDQGVKTNATTTLKRQRLNNGACANYIMHVSCMYYPKFYGSHFDLPSIAIHRMTVLGGNFVWATTLDKKKKKKKKRTIVIMHHVISKNLQSDLAAMNRSLKS